MTIEQLPANQRVYLPDCILDNLYQEAKDAGFRCLGASFVLSEKVDLIFDEDHEHLQFVLKREYA